jgi:hypothetical protein
VDQQKFDASPTSQAKGLTFFVWIQAPARPSSCAAYLSRRLLGGPCIPHSGCSSRAFPCSSRCSSEEPAQVCGGLVVCGHIERLLRPRGNLARTPGPPLLPGGVPGPGTRARFTGLRYQAAQTAARAPRGGGGGAWWCHPALHALHISEDVGAPFGCMMVPRHCTRLAGGA